MDFAKFIDILASKRLWFSRLDRLDDPREGRLTDEEFARLSGRGDGMVSSIEAERSMSYVSCWCESDGESMAMWDLYGTGDCRVAVKTTMGFLKAAIGGISYPIYCGRVRYIDWRNHDRDPGNVIAMCVRKSQSYRHESEVRLVIWEALREAGEERGDERPLMTLPELARVAQDVVEILAQLNPGTDLKSIEGRQAGVGLALACQERLRLAKATSGIHVEFESFEWLSEVIVGPKSQGWQLELVAKVLERYDIESNVRLSDLAPPSG